MGQYDWGSYPYYKPISDLTGIEAFVNLDTLNCLRNKLTRLDLSNNTYIRYLDLSANDITNLNISKNYNLEYLDCGAEFAMGSRDPGNSLTRLDVSTNIDLKELHLRNIPTLHEVCVWETFNPDSISIDTSESPNVCFQTDCNGDCSIVGVGESCPQEVAIYPNPTGDLLNIEIVIPIIIQSTSLP